MHILHSKRNKNLDKRKKALEIIEFLVVVSICIIMYFRERDIGGQNDVRVHFELGDNVLFGTYLEEPIEWRVIKVDKNGQAVLIAENILTMKAFNAPDSGCYNYDDEKNDYWSVHETEADKDMELQAYVRGNSCWAVSDLRTWLNSDRENVIYDGIGPVASAMSERKNGYAYEAGFLTGFTEQEREAIIPTENVTIGNVLSKGEAVHSTDLVYLLSQEELAWLAEADVNIRATPTEQAVEQDQTRWYNMFSREFGIDAYCWWLRDPVPDQASKCYLVDNGYTSDLLLNKNVGAEGFGVRPVMRVDMRKIVQFYEENTDSKEVGSVYGNEQKE